MEALLSHCVRASGEQIDPSLSPAPSVLCEDGRGTLYALGADGTVRASSARHVNAAARGAVDPRDASTLTPNGGGDRVGDAVETFRPDPPIDFEPRTLCVSPSGRFAAIGGLRHAAGSSTTRASANEPLAPPSSALAVVCLRSRSSSRPDGGDDPDDPRCARVSLLEEAFAAHHSCRVLRAQWHPNADGHLVLLLSDGTLRVFDAATDVANPESAYRLDPWGRQTQSEKPSPYPLRPEIVDFAFAPPHGWGALALILLGREGDVYTLCPFAPAGARFPRVTLEALARGSRGDARADAWLAAAFPVALLARFSRARADGRARGLYDESDESGDEPYDARGGDSDDDGRNPDRGGGGGVRDDDEAYAPGGATLAARRCRGVFFESGSHVAPALRGPLPLGTDPVEGDGDAGGGALGRGAVARCLAAAPFAAGEGGGALLAVAHQRGGSGGVSATLDVLILPQEPSPGWARVETRPRAREATRGGGGPLTTYAYGYLDDDDDDADTIALTPPVDDEDEGALPPLLAIDRVRLVATRDDGGGGVAGEGAPGRSRAAAAANELAPFVSAAFDPGCRERVFCCAGGAVHAVTLTWLAQVEGAVDDEDDGEDDAFARGAFDAAAGGGSSGGGVVGDGGGRLPLPAVVTLLDSSRALLGVAPVGDPLAEGLVLAVDVAGNAEALHPAPPLPPEGDADAAESAEAAETLRRSLAAAAEASAELRALAEGPADGADGVPAASGSRLTPGTPEGSGELARARWRSRSGTCASRAACTRRAGATARGWAWRWRARRRRRACCARGPGFGAAAQGDAGATARARGRGHTPTRASGCGGWRRWSGPSRGRRRRRRARSA